MGLDDLIDTIKETDEEGWSFVTTFNAYVKAVENGIETLTSEEFAILEKVGLIEYATE